MIFVKESIDMVFFDVLRCRGMANMRYSNGYEAVIALLREHPNWRGVVKAALEEARTIKNDRFAGAWVLERAKKYGIHWIPNLRKLVSYGILVKMGDSSRGGRRAYYSIPDMEGVEKALMEAISEHDQSPYTSYEVTGSGVARRQTIKVPLYTNLASCGNPNDSETHVDEYIEVDTRLARPGYQYYLIRTEGDSMDLAGISSGDLALIRSQNYADIGQKVVACIDGGVTIKELQNTGEYSVLVPRSSNKEHVPIVLSKDDEIQGVVVAILPNANSK